MGASGRFVALAASAALFVALAPTAWAATPGPAYSWGTNNVGRLGTGQSTSTDDSVPTVIAAPGQFTSISAGWNNGCGLGGDDSAYCWGRGADGQLGNGAYDDSNVPVRVLGPAGGFAAIAAGNLTSCALQNGTSAAYCWGDGWQGQLGNGSSGFGYKSNVPVAVSGGRSFTGIDVGQDSACAVALDDSAYCWGWNDQGQLGVGRSGGAPDDSATVPVLVMGSYRFVEVSVGGQFACGVTRTSGATGPGVCWGWNQHGQLGKGNWTRNAADDSVPRPLAGGLVLRSIAAGANHACAISTDDSAYCWGDGTNGQLGNGSSGYDDSVATPTRVLIPGDAPVRDISAGSQSSCAITDDTAYCWGWQAYGQLGNGDSGAVARALPVAVTLSGIDPANSPVQVTSGENYSAFIVQPRMAFAGTAFPSAQVGQSTSTLVPVQNTRPWTITITGTSVTGTGVTRTGTTCGGALPSGATCTVSLAWTPASIGALSGASLTVNYVGNSSSTTLTGIGTDPTPPTPIPPSAPGSVTATAGHASATMTWTAPTSPGSYPVTTYQVTSSPGGHTCLTSALTCTVTGLTNGTTYTFTVKALSGAGWGETSAPSNAVTPVAATKPSITITGSRDGQRITVTGTAMHVDSQTVRPWIRFPGETTYSEGTAVIPVAADGSFIWSRKTGKKAYVYIAHGAVKSNTVTIPAR